jgi:hypothetical protein
MKNEANENQGRVHAFGMALVLLAALTCCTKPDVDAVMGASRGGDSDACRTACNALYDRRPVSAEDQRAIERNLVYSCKKSCSAFGDREACLRGDRLIADPLPATRTMISACVAMYGCCSMRLDFTEGSQQNAPATCREWAHGDVTESTEAECRAAQVACEIDIGRLSLSDGGATDAGKRSTR